MPCVRAHKLSWHVNPARHARAPQSASRWPNHSMSLCSPRASTSVKCGEIARYIAADTAQPYALQCPPRWPLSLAEMVSCTSTATYNNLPSLRPLCVNCSKTHAAILSQAPPDWLTASRTAGIVRYNAYIEGAEQQALNSCTLSQSCLNVSLQCMLFHASANIMPHEHITVWYREGGISQEGGFAMVCQMLLTGVTRKEQVLLLPASGQLYMRMPHTVNCGHRPTPRQLIKCSEVVLHKTSSRHAGHMHAHTHAKAHAHHICMAVN